MLIARGYVCTVYNVTTNQNYIVEMHRVSRPGIPPTAGLPPVIIQTGLIGTSADFVMGTGDETIASIGIGRNMATTLVQQGYDVWLSNNRGNQYGLAHKTLKVDSAAFWDFSFDEISQYDTPAFIDYVLNQTGAGMLFVKQFLSRHFNIRYFNKTKKLIQICKNVISGWSVALSVINAFANLPALDKLCE